MEGSSIRMIFMNEILFSSASTRISAKGASILRIIGNQLKKLKDRDIYVEGHTDSNPVLDWRIRRYYPTNWEFSVVRATRVSRFLIRELKINPKRITAAGRGEYMPRASNTTPRGRAVNRRIEILISPKSVILENRNRELRRQKVSTETIPVRR
jgi:chemotaxis protein MotB